MHWAVLADHPEAARELLNRQELSLGITNWPGHHTPLDLARLLDCAALVALLEASEDRSEREPAPDDTYPPPAGDSTPRPPITRSIPDPPRWK